MNTHSLSTVRCKQVGTAEEVAQVLALNHQVFAEEIGQYQTNPSGLLVDRLHTKNRYFIALRGERVVGMISVHPGPEFSVARRLPDSAMLKEFACPLEVRLLAIVAEERSRTVLAGCFGRCFTSRWRVGTRIC